MKIEAIDLRPPKPIGRWLWVVNGLLALGLFGWLVLGQLNKRGQAEDLVSARVKAMASSAALLKQQEMAASKPESKAVVLPFDWDAVLLALEKTQVDGVSIESFKIDAVGREMTLVLSFDSYDQVGLFLSSLEQAEMGLNCGLTHAEKQSVELNFVQRGSAIIFCK